MSYGKYSPTLPRHEREFIYNAKGEIPTEWNPEMKAAGIEYDTETMFGNYDSDGFDSYGYSAYNANGDYIGIGQGVDREGLTENEHFENWLDEQRYYDRINDEMED
jgi:hypothetical protein